MNLQHISQVRTLLHSFRKFMHKHKLLYNKVTQIQEVSTQQTDEGCASCNLV